MRQSLKKGASFRRHANEAQAAKLSTLLNRFFTLNPKRDEVMVRGSKGKRRKQNKKQTRSQWDKEYTANERMEEEHKR